MNSLQEFIPLLLALPEHKSQPAENVGEKKKTQRISTKSKAIDSDKSTSSKKKQVKNEGGPSKIKKPSKFKIKSGEDAERQILSSLGVSEKELELFQQKNPDFVDKRVKWINKRLERKREKKISSYTNQLGIMEKEEFAAIFRGKNIDRIYETKRRVLEKFQFSI